MDSSGSLINRQTIDPYYKANNVFERDEAYYQQILMGTRRVSNNLIGSARHSSQSKSKYLDPLKNVQSQMIGQSRVQNKNYLTSNNQVQQYGSVNYSKIEQYRSQAGNQTVARGGQIQINEHEYNQSYQKNLLLKGELDSIINGNNDYGNSSNVIKLAYYSNLSQGEIVRIKQQESQIIKLEEKIKRNDIKISNYKKAAEQLNLRMGNIQTIDKQIYKTLQGGVNRDRQLLDKATSALARGQKREDIAKILQQVLTS